nr:histidine--tRNA ligase, cytoplasmic [Tanacetum cinerariifolium]
MQHDHAASLLSILADVCVALSCEALKTDPTTAFNSFTDSGDGFSDKDRASVASDLRCCFMDPRWCTILEKLSNALLSLFDLKDARLDQGTCGFLKEQMAVRKKALLIITNVFERHELCSLRYDLTVPFARYVAMNRITSFRGYQMGKVYRRDDPSKGRYRVFYQCDFDIAGDESIGADFEVVNILTELLELNIGEYELNHRKLVDGMFDICGVPSNKFRTVCSSIDKLDRQMFEQIKKELGLATKTVEKIGSFVKLRGHPFELLLELKKEGSQILTNDSSKQALNDLDKLFQALDSTGSVDKVVFNLSLARGLDYYIGVIYEAITKRATRVGSIAGGGRYDDLIGTFRSKPMINRLLEPVRHKCWSAYLVAAKLVNKCWRANLKASFLVNKRVSKHFDRAKEFGIPSIVMVGEQETSGGVVTLKNKMPELKKRFMEAILLKSSSV